MSSTESSEPGSEFGSEFESEFGSESGSTESATTKLVLGEVNGVFGVHGWNKVFSETAPRVNIVKYQQWYLSRKGGPWKRYEVVKGREQGKNVVVQLAGVTDRDAARELVGCTIAVERDQLPPLPDDEYYWSDLLGFEVVATDGRAFGTLERMFETGANDVMVVSAVSDVASGAGSEGTVTGTESEILIPWIKGSVVQEVLMQQRKIVVDWDPDY